jgi:hypothetical protein
MARSTIRVEPRHAEQSLLACGEAVPSCPGERHQPQPDEDAPATWAD